MILMGRVPNVFKFNDILTENNKKFAPNRLFDFKCDVSRLFLLTVEIEKKITFIDLKLVSFL